MKTFALGTALGALALATAQPALAQDAHDEAAPEQIDPDAEMALENARDVYTRRNEGVSIWVVESKHITASNPADNGEMFEPAQSKVYRHPTFYNLPDEVKHM